MAIIPPDHRANPLEAEARRAEHDSRGPRQATTSTLAVAATLTRDGDAGRVRVRGELAISEGRIAFVPFATTSRLSVGRELVHRARTVTIARAWLRPPWANSFVLLDDRNLHLCAGTPPFARRRRPRRLQQAGFTVNELSVRRAPA